MLRAAFLPANRAWTLMFPDLSLCGIDLERRTLFGSKRELLDALHRIGLTLDEKDKVVLC